MAEQRHLDRLSAIDAGFLAQEKPNTHMHIGLALFEGHPPGLDELVGAEGIEVSPAQLVALREERRVAGLDSCG